MKTKSKPGKLDFLDDVVDEMGPGKEGADKQYGADMKDEDGEEEGDDEAAKEDRLMAAGAVAKALGMPNADREKLADALEAFYKACEADHSKDDEEEEEEGDEDEPEKEDEAE